jgi:hypothetical protein
MASIEKSLYLMRKREISLPLKLDGISKTSIKTANVWFSRRWCLALAQKETYHHSFREYKLAMRNTRRSLCTADTQIELADVKVELAIAKLYQAAKCEITKTTTAIWFHSLEIASSQYYDSNFKVLAPSSMNFYNSILFLSDFSFGVCTWLIHDYI